MKKVWSYIQTTNKYGGSGHVAYLGHCTQSEFVYTVNGGLSRGISWVRQQTGETHNDEEVRIALEHPGQVVVVNSGLYGGTRDILKLLPIIKGGQR